MNAKITYKLSADGQRADLLAGGNGKQLQEILVSREQPEFSGVVQNGDVQSDGSVTLRADYYGFPDFHAPQTAASILEYMVARKSKEEAEVRDRKEAARAKTLAVVAEKKMDRSDMEFRTAYDGWCVGIAKYTAVSPAWDYGCDDDLKKTPEALAFVAECDALNAAAKAQAEVEAQADLAGKKQKAEAARIAQEIFDKKRADWFAKHGLDANDLRLKIEDGALASVPSGCWESHSRGKNWLAKISVSPSSPGGLDRDFADKAKGESYYMLPTFSAGDAIEFGADYYSGSGRKNANRWYGFVVALVQADGDDPAWLVIRGCDTGKAACKAGAAWAKEHGPLTVADAVDAGIARINGEGAIVPAPSQN